MPSLSKNYLKEYDLADKKDKYKLVNSWIGSEDRLPFFEQLRNERPVLVTPECTLVSLFPDVRDMLEMPKIFTVDLYKPKMSVTGPDDGYLMAHDDDALHYREKSLMQGMLNRDDLPRVRKLIEESAKNILVDAEGSIEFVNEYCRMVPVTLVQDYFGLDGVEPGDLIEWSYWNQYDAFNNQPFDMLTEEESQYITDKHNAISDKLAAYIASLVIRKLVIIKTTGGLRSMLGYTKRILLGLVGMSVKTRKDDIVTRMLRSAYAKEVDFPLDRLGINAGGLLIGAIETTSQAVSQVIEYFINNENVMKKAKQAASFEDRAEFDAIVWEALRFVPIRPDIFRKASMDYTIAKGTEHETEVKKGTIVRLLTQSAMFDNYAFEKSNEFNPNRNWYHNFNFGFGSHQCLGKYIGMVMIPEMVRQAVLRVGLKNEGPINYKNGPFPEEYKLTWN